ncbi:hypothetical protein BH10PLA2_BH10PLA2_30670 [soil metagenome]
MTIEVRWGLKFAHVFAVLEVHIVGSVLFGTSTALCLMVVLESTSPGYIGENR